MVTKTESFKMNNVIYHTLAELEMARKFEKINTFITTDGRVFVYESDAKEHQESLQPHRVELKDLLNKIIILASLHKEDAYLQNVGTYAQRVINSTYEAEHNEEQYHNSNCY